MLEKKAKILFIRQIIRQSKNRKRRPHFAKPRGGQQAAERNGIPPQNALGGALRRPRKFPEKRKKFDTGAYIQFCSHLFYQKFLEKTIAPPAGGAGQETAKTRRLAGKNFLP